MELVKRSLTKKDGKKLFAAYKGPYLDEFELTSLVQSGSLSDFYQ